LKYLLLNIPLKTGQNHKKKTNSSEGALLIVTSKNRLNIEWPITIPFMADEDL
jgi:hypothetical protein